MAQGRLRYLRVHCPNKTTPERIEPPQTSQANKKLNITLRDKIVRKFITPTLDPSTEEVPTPKVPFNARVKITAVSLRDIIDDAQSVSDNVKLEVSPEKFIVRATGELSSAIIELDKGSDAILELDAKETCRATYNLNYLGEIIRAGSGASEVATLEFSTNMPIKASCFTISLLE